MTARLLLMALALTAAGCGADEPPGPKQSSRPAPAPPVAKAPTPSLDACALLTSEDAQRALGKPVGAPVRGDVPPVFSCSFLTENRLDNVSVNVTVYRDAREAHDAHLMTLRINSYPEIAGLGDRAYQSVVSDVTVLKGRYELSVDISASIPKDAQVVKAKDLATRALAKLPQ